MGRLDPLERLKRYRYALTMLAMLTGMLWVFDTPTFRHGLVRDTRDCAVAQVANVPSNLDILILGTSRTREGVDPDQLSRQLSGDHPLVFNFARSGHNIMRDARIAMDVLDGVEHPRLVLMELNLATLASNAEFKSIPQPSGVIGMMTYADIWKMFDLYPERAVVERVHVVLQRMLIKLKASVIQVASGSAWRHAVHAWTSRQAPSVCKADGYEVQTDRHRKIIQRIHRQYQARYGNLALASDDSFVQGLGWQARRELAYVDRVRALANTHGARFLVYAPWNAYQPPLSKLAVRRIREVIPEFVAPDPATVRATWSQFLDGHHLAAEGRTTVTSWLSTVIMPADPDGAS